MAAFTGLGNASVPVEAFEGQVSIPFPINTTNFEFSVGGTVTYTYTAIPEPSTFVMLGFGGAALLLKRRRRKLS